MQWFLIKLHINYIISLILGFVFTDFAQFL